MLCDKVYCEWSSHLHSPGRVLQLYRSLNFVLLLQTNRSFTLCIFDVQYRGS